LDNEQYLVKKLQNRNNKFLYSNIRFTFAIIFKLIIIMKEGIVRFFDESKGFGFIKVKGSDEEYFVHVTGLIDQIRENDEVTFELKQGKKGLNAVNVKLV